MKGQEEAANGQGQAVKGRRAAVEARGKAVKGGGKAVKSRGKAVQFVGKCPLTRWPQRRTTGAEASPPQPDVHLDRDRKGSRRLRDARQKRLRNGSETHSSTFCRAYCDDASTVDRDRKERRWLRDGRRVERQKEAVSCVVPTVMTHSPCRNRNERRWLREPVSCASDTAERGSVLCNLHSRKRQCLVPVAR